MTLGHHISNVEKEAELVQSRLLVYAIFLTLLLPEHQEPRQVLPEPWGDLEGG